jgi:hypothetical protein
MNQLVPFGGPLCSTPCASASSKGCLPRRELTPEMLLPAGSEERIDAGFVGVLGAFEFYRGKARGHRMANLRLILR